MKLVITRQLYCNREIKLLKLKANYNYETFNFFPIVL